MKQVDTKQLMEYMDIKFQQIQANMATKQDIADVRADMATKKDLDGFATKEDLKAFATKEDLKAFATKEDLKAFATKQDLQAFVTKQDLVPIWEAIQKLIEKVTFIEKLLVEELVSIDTKFEKVWARLDRLEAAR